MVITMQLEDQVKFLGPIPYPNINSYLQKSHLFINLSGTHSLDKTVLEAMLTDHIVLTSNLAFKPILPPELIIPKDQPKVLAHKIKYILNLPDQKKLELRKQLKQQIVSNYNLDELVKKIVGLYK